MYLLASTHNHTAATIRLLLRAVAAIVGVFCLFTAWLAYPGEENKLQSHLEDLWLQIDDRQKHALSFHAAFMQQAARAVSQSLDLIFGEKLLSLRCVGTSVAWSVASFPLAFLCFWLVTRFFWRSSGIEFTASELLEFFVVATVYILIGSAPLRIHSMLLLRLWASGVLLSTGGLWYAAFYSRNASLRDLLIEVGAAGAIAMALSFACDTLFIAGTRKVLRWAGSMEQTWKIAALIFINCLFGALLVVAPFGWGLFALVGDALDFFAPKRVMVESFHDVVLSVAASNTLDLFASLAVVILCVLLILHRVLWPLINRSVFRLQALGPNARRGLLSAAGASLIAIASHSDKLASAVKAISGFFKG